MVKNNYFTQPRTLCVISGYILSIMGQYVSGVFPSHPATAGPAPDTRPGDRRTNSARPGHFTHCWDKGMKRKLAHIDLNLT